ncbi:O-methyltransferase [Trinickia mobilis]|uniref:O-methyltransferase n=1 Tax=Trinickia mobilis TaxID=2816356 RepID=UPI001A8CE26B|nr:class I SAM-dependent methyltransferase [Trinickia mobilis]
MLTVEIEALLHELEVHGAEIDATATDRTQKLLNLERPTAELLFLLVTASGRRRVLEIGTSNGYSAIWLACAMAKTAGNPITTIDRDAARAAQARENLRRAGVQSHAQVIEGDATRWCAALDGPFDCVFFDADRISAPSQLELLLPKLTDDVLLIADNALSHPEEIAGYLATVSALPQFDATLVPVGKGLHVAYRRPHINGVASK